MIRSISFKPVRNDFQKNLADDINNTKSSENLLIFDYKTTNLYEMTPEQYKTNNVTKTYRKAERSTQLNIDREAKTISKILQLEKRLERYAERPAFISLKDHKENFKHYNQWRSTSTVIEWFGAIENKKNCKFIKFDIAEFYPPISAKLLEKSINFARSIIEIEDKIINIIKHSRKSLLFHNGNAWVKKEGNPLSDVTMGSSMGQRFVSSQGFIC